MNKELLQQAHKLGFMRGAEWANRSDLLVDTDSPAYFRERDYDVAAIAQPEQPAPNNLQKRLEELHLYEEINEHYAVCNPGPGNLRDWVVDRMGMQPEQTTQEIAWRCTGSGLKRFMTQNQYDAQEPGVKKWYEPFKCASCLTTPQPVTLKAKP